MGMGIMEVVEIIWAGLVLLFPLQEKPSSDPRIAFAQLVI